MQNTNPNAIVRLGDLQKPPFKQLPDGTITIDFSAIPPEQLDEPVLEILKNITVNLVPVPADPADPTAQLHNGFQQWSVTYIDDTQSPPAPATAVLWSIPVSHHYDTTGAYVGTMLNYSLPDLT